MVSGWVRLTSVALCAASVGACASGSGSGKAEKVAQTLERIAPAERLQRIDEVAEPSSYRIEFERFVNGRSDGTRLAPVRVVRDIVRPYNESGNVNRRLGFVRERGSGASRVALVRPLPDDARPRLYPPAHKATKQRTVAGRRCAVYAEGKDEYCVDAAGLVLVTRTGTTLEIAKRVTVGRTRRSPAQLAAQLAKGFVNTDRGSIRPIDPDTAPGGATDYSLDAPPEGFTLVGRYAVVALSKAVLDRNSRKVIAGIVDVYVNGIEALVVERGGKLDTSAADDSDLGSLRDAHDVDLGALGRGRAGIGGTSAFGYREVRAAPSQGRYVVIAGTLPEATLVSLAQSLHAWPGTRITYLDHPVQGPSAPPTTEG